VQYEPTIPWFHWAIETVDVSSMQSFIETKNCSGIRHYVLSSSSWVFDINPLGKENSAGKDGDKAVAQGGRHTTGQRHVGMESLAAE
jgi:hypothetical protein